MDQNPTPELPGYDLLRPIGHGATSQVWQVRRADGQRLAAKIVEGDLDPTERRLLQRLDHDHVLRLHDVVLDAASGRTALITDLAEGGSLEACLAARGRLTPGEIVTVLSPVARTLHDLHALGLVHSDLSPANILLTAAGKPLVADLGVSRLAGHDRDLWVTERWAAPEVLAGEDATPAADVHALGAVTWAALAGFAPPAAHERPDLAEVAPHAPARLLDLVEDAMAYDPQRRPSAGDFALRLWECADAEPAPVAGLGTVDDGPPEEGGLTRRVIRERRAALAEQEPAPPGWRERIAGLWARVHRGLLPALGAGGALAIIATVLWIATSPSPSYAGVPVAARTTPATPHGPAVRPQPSVRDVLVASLAARARAWESEDAARLGDALVPGSAASRSDTAALRAARADGSDYRGVRFVVRSVGATTRTTDRIVVTATVDRPAYRVVSATGTRTVAATSASVTFTLQRDGERWRIARWQAA